jgi:preprotein translocase subunit SecF
VHQGLQKEKKMLNVMKNYKFWFAISGLMLAIGIIALAVYGLKLGVDFTGGTVSQLQFQQTPDLGKVSEVVTKEEFGGVRVQATDNNGVIVRTKPVEKEQHDKMLAELKTQIGEFTETSYTSIGPIIGQELRVKAFWQLLLVSLGIVFYIAYAFRRITRPITSWAFGGAAIVALLHDLLVVLGVFALLGHFAGVEIDSLFITALLTVLGFSVHDTIVVFDRIRENLKNEAGHDLAYIVNHSINQTIVRSLNTSLTVLFVLLTLILFGGDSIKNFVLALFIGIAAGTYSSIFIASPLLVLWQRYQAKRR